MPTAEQARRQLPTALLKLTSLQRRAAALPASQSRLVPETIGELERALHELDVACDHVQALNGEIEQAHLESEREVHRYRQYFDLAPDAHIITTPEGIITDANRAAGDLLHVRERWLRDKPLMLYVVEERGNFIAELPRLQTALTFVPLTLRIRPRDKAPLTARALVRRLSEFDGAVRLWWILRPEC
jgi:PAS domain-containing protein